MTGYSSQLGVFYWLLPGGDFTSKRTRKDPPCTKPQSLMICTTRRVECVVLDVWAYSRKINQIKKISPVTWGRNPEPILIKLGSVFVVDVNCQGFGGNLVSRWLKLAIFCTGAVLLLTRSRAPFTRTINVQGVDSWWCSQMEDND